jgi:2-dehydropantoate 2-reductase
MRIGVIGAGAMGCLYGGLLARRPDNEVVLVDIDRAHVDAINRDGLHLDGTTGDLRIEVAATTEPASVRDRELVLVFVDSNTTRRAGELAAPMLAPDGVVLTLQNGVGNIEALCEVLPKERVLAGISFHSAARQAPGHVTHTHAERTWIGELDGTSSERLLRLEKLLADAGFTPIPVDNVQGFIWGKWILNCSINALCAVTGLRLGEMIRVPELDAFQDRITEEALAVIRAKGITIPESDPRKLIKTHCWKKFSKPSMMQHVEQGKRTEIDALNGAVVRESRALGLQAPCNESLVALVKGRELARQLRVHGPEPDYAALEAEAQRTPCPY